MVAYFCYEIFNCMWSYLCWIPIDTMMKPWKKKPFKKGNHLPNLILLLGFNVTLHHYFQGFLSLKVLQGGWVGVLSFREGGHTVATLPPRMLQWKMTRKASTFSQKSTRSTIAPSSSVTVWKKSLVKSLSPKKYEDDTVDGSEILHQLIW